MISLGVAQPPRAERRSTLAYSDQGILRSILEAAGGSVRATADATAALEAAAACWQHALEATAVAPSTARTAALTPALLGLVGRELVRRGEFVGMLDVDGARVAVLPAGHWTVRGGVRPSSWRYELEIYGPDGSESWTVPAAGVLHLRYSVQVGRPERGLAPLTWAGSTASLAGNLEQRQSEETGAAVGSVLPVPRDGTGDDPDADGDNDTDPLAKLRADLAGMKGRPMLVESAGSWASAEGLPASQRHADIWRQMRIGGEVPDSHVTLRTEVTRAVLAACGVPAEIIMGADASAAREAWRRFAFGTVAPALRCVESECRDKLGEPGLTLDPSALAAADLVSRSRAVSSLTTAGIEVERALQIAGLT